MPRHLGMRAVRVLCRWHNAWSGVPSFRPIALATALVIVGGPVLETGAVSSAPDPASAAPAPTTAAPEARDVFVALVIPTAGSPLAPVLVVTGPDLQLEPVDAVSGWLVEDDAWADSDRSGRTSGLLAVVGDASALARGSAAPAVRTSTQGTANAMTAAEVTIAKKKAARKRLIKRRKAGPWLTSQRVTWYGPGFYGNRTACGQRYTRTIRGVAHRTLPCGTMVQFRWKGKVKMAPVIDRGPYGHRDLKFDWSAAVACKVFRPRRGTRGCFTRQNVRYRVVGKVNLNRWFKIFKD